LIQIGQSDVISMLYNGVILFHAYRSFCRVLKVLQEVWVIQVP